MAREVNEIFDVAMFDAELREMERDGAATKTRLAYCEKAIAALLVASQPRPDPAEAVSIVSQNYLGHCEAEIIANDGRTIAQRLVDQAVGASMATTREELLQQRREFARRYHPDMVPAAKRREAEEIMKIANATIDDRLSELRDKY